MTVLIRDGHIQSLTQDTLPWEDPAIQYGAAGFFETMRWEGGRVKRLDDHLARLNRALTLWQLELPFATKDGWMDAIEVARAEFAPSEPLRIKIIAGADPQSQAAKFQSTRAWVQAGRLDAEYALPIRQRRPYRLGIFRDYTISAAHPLSGFKSTQYQHYREARRRTRLMGWDEGILLNEHGQVVEACHFNLFWINGGRVCTPDPKSGCLPGIMAGRVIQFAQKIGMPVETGLYSVEDILRSDFVFLTNSVAELVAVKEIEGRKFEEDSHSVFERLLPAADE